MHCRQFLRKVKQLSVAKDLWTFPRFWGIFALFLRIGLSPDCFELTIGYCEKSLCYHPGDFDYPDWRV